MEEAQEMKMVKTSELCLLNSLQASILIKPPGKVTVLAYNARNLPRWQIQERTHSLDLHSKPWQRPSEKWCLFYDVEPHDQQRPIAGGSLPP